MSLEHGRARELVTGAGDGPLPTPAIEDLLIFAAADLQLFLNLSRILQPLHLFKPDEFVARVAFAAMLQSYARYQGWTLQTLQQAAAEYLNTHESERQWVTQEAQDRLFSTQSGLLYEIAMRTLPVTEVNLRMATSNLQRLADERLVVETLRRQVSPKAGLPDVQQLLTSVQTMNEQIRSVSAPPSGDLFDIETMEAIVEQPVLRMGYPLIDNAIGGQRVGDVNSIIGYTGAGKSTCALDMVSHIAKHVYHQHVVFNEPLRPIVFISVEEPAANLRSRLFSNFFDIPRRKFEPLDLSKLSTQDTLETYERDMQRSAASVLSERERFDALRTIAGKLIRVVDLSGISGNPSAGSGGVPEIANAVNGIAQQMGVAPHTVFVDYAGLMVERMIFRGNSDGGADPGRALQLRLKRFSDDTMQQVSQRFGTTVWLLQQLKGVVANYSPTKTMTLADVEGCSTFANNQAVSLIMGLPCKKTGIRMLHFAKSRYRLDQAELMPQLLKIHPLFSRMQNVTKSYRVDSAARQFVSARDARTIGGLGEWTV